MDELKQNSGRIMFVSIFTAQPFTQLKYLRNELFYETIMYIYQFNELIWIII